MLVVVVMMVMLGVMACPGAREEISSLRAVALVPSGARVEVDHMATSP
jgi:hypothetical protein